MKTISSLLFTFGLLACISFTAGAINYFVSFTGSGASTTVDSVVVQNLYKGTQVIVPGGSLLSLSEEESSIDNLNTIADFALIYPNPIIDNATYSFVAKKGGNTQISVYGLDGRKLTGMDIDLLQGKHTFQLTLPKGVYLVQAKGNGFLYSTKAICLNLTNNQPKISYTGNTSYSKPQQVPAAEVKMQYTSGDQILYKGYSGNYCTIVTDKPTETKTTDFKFVHCTDADGNHYAVVHIGNQTWMAENLKTTKYRNDDAIGTTTAQIFTNTTSKYQWAYGGNEANAAKYGRLYTWYAATDARNIAPVGWHVPTDVEWSTLENYLIANGYNYDCTTTNNKIGKALAATNVWKPYTGIGTIGDDLTKNNSSGFSSLPGGYRYNYGQFSGIGYYDNWWSSTESDTSFAWYRRLSTYFFVLYRSSISKDNGYSIRCLSD